MKTSESSEMVVSGSDTDEPEGGGSLEAGELPGDWFIAGEPDEQSTVPLATTASVQTAAVLSIHGVGIKIACNSTTLGETSLEVGEADIGTATSLALEGCSTTEPKTKCELEAQPTTIKTHPLGATVK